MRGSRNAGFVAAVSDFALIVLVAVLPMVLGFVLSGWRLASILAAGMLLVALAVFARYGRHPA